MRRLFEGLAALGIALAAHAVALRALDRPASPPRPQPPEREIALADGVLNTLAESWSRSPGVPMQPSRMRAPTQPETPAMETRSDASSSAVEPPVIAMALPAMPIMPEIPELDTSSDAAPQPLLDTANDALPLEPEPELSRAPARVPAPRPRPAPQPVEISGPQRAKTAPLPTSVETLTIEEFLAQQSHETVLEPALEPEPELTMTEFYPELVHESRSEPPAVEATVMEFFAESEPSPPTSSEIQGRFETSIPQPALPMARSDARTPSLASSQGMPGISPLSEQSAAQTLAVQPSTTQRRAIATPAPPQTQPTSSTAVQAPTRAGPSVDLRALRAGYARAISALIEQRKSYPRQARQRRQTGIVRVTFTLDGNGRVMNARIDAASGSRILDKAALDLIREKIGQFPSPPAELGNELSFTVPISYVLQ